ncbi:MAG: DUF6134 family protein [Methylophilus sp.]
MKKLIPVAKLFIAFNAFCLSVLPVAHAKDWAFDVWLDKQKIGTHTFSLNNNRLQSRADFNVKVLFINAYRYQHQADETWQGACLANLKAHTEENKVVTDVNGQLQDKQFVTEKRSAKKSDSQTLPACIMTFAYWNAEILKQSRLLNPQNAEYLDVTVTDEGAKTILVKGENIQTRKYRLNGRLQGKDKLKITLWYDQQQEWVALESVTPEGYRIVYKLV